MSEHRITGYTNSTELKTDVDRVANNPATPWDSESEIVIAAVRKLLGDREAERKATEYNVETRLQQALDTLERDLHDTVQQAVSDTLADADKNGATTASDGQGDQKAAHETGTGTGTGIDWSEREDNGDWRQ
jgi:Arc/MetJ-type ribon-helix-helix transcriptional regulator